MKRLNLSQTLIQDDNTKYNDAVIVWKKMESNHTGDPDNSTALITDKFITMKYKLL